MDLFLTSYRDQLTPDEEAAVPPLEVNFTPRGGGSRTVPAPDLPDLEMRYTITYKIAGAVQSSPDDVYVQVASVSLPWSVFHRNGDDKLAQVLKIHPQAFFRGTDEVSVDATLDVHPTASVFRIRVTLEAEGDELLADFARTFLVADRAGVSTRPVPFVEGGGE